MAAFQGTSSRTPSEAPRLPGAGVELRQGCEPNPSEEMVDRPTVEARKLEYGRPLIPKQQKEGKPAINHSTYIFQLFGVYCIPAVAIKSSTVDPETVTQ